MRAYDLLDEYQMIPAGLRPDTEQEMKWLVKDWKRIKDQTRQLMVLQPQFEERYRQQQFDCKIQLAEKIEETLRNDLRAGTR
jgi:predicted amidophosphoribosyltransferase